MTRHLTFMIAILTSVMLVACGGNRRPSENISEPPAPVLPTVDPISVDERIIVVVELNEIRLAEDSPVLAIPLDNVLMIPLGIDEEITAQMQYIEDGSDIVITRVNPYVPTSNWDISIDRDDLNGENFGMWFVISNTGDRSQLTREVFVELLRDSAILLTATGITPLLAMTPLPDEIVSGTVASTRVRSIINTLKGYRTTILVEGNDFAERWVEMQIENGFNILDEVSKLDYFNEVYIIIDAEQDYLMNNQIIATSADGSLEFVFSIFEVSNQLDGERYIPSNVIVETPPQCNPDYDSALATGMQAQVATSSLNVANEVTSQSTIQFRLRRGDTVDLLGSLCHANALWWEVRADTGEVGWVRESTGTNIFLEPYDA